MNNYIGVSNPSSAGAEWESPLLWHFLHGGGSLCMRSCQPRAAAIKRGFVYGEAIIPHTRPLLSSAVPLHEEVGVGWLVVFFLVGVSCSSLRPLLSVISAWAGVETGLHSSSPPERKGGGAGTPPSTSAKLHG